MHTQLKECLSVKENSDRNGIRMFPIMLSNEAIDNIVKWMRIFISTWDKFDKIFSDLNIRF